MRQITAGLMAGLLVGLGVGSELPLTASAANWEIIETDIPDWKDTITAAFGEGAIAGGAATQTELGNKGVFELLTKHFNAVTFGNELKPDCLFDYSNDKCPGTEEISFNGRKLTVPKPVFGRADSMLKKILKWNEENPDHRLQVRGHVLLWHSQTPEWFFHEDYDKTKDYVDKDTMNLRLEWYIKTVLEHYVGEDSPYRDMFYGWDVVNEAISDSGGVYRTDTENGTDKLSDSTHGSKSSWWHVYESNEFIINAFAYANKYAPAQLELYYNDYGDISPTKKERIKELLTAVKEAEGAPGKGTRIDGFGMQGHYDMNSFSITDFEQAAREYGQIVGSVQLTELDFKASSAYDGTDAAKESEYAAQARNYQAIFEAYKKLAQEGIKIKGITFWGTVDKFSWLQSRSNVGGGADGSTTQCPLMFDDDYKAKPAYWAFVDPSQIVAPVQKLGITYSEDGKFSKNPEYTFAQEGVEVTFIPLWNEEGLKIQCSVTDKQADDNDSVTVYVDEENARKSGIKPVSVTVDRKDAGSIGGGYRAVFNIPLTEPAVGKKIGFDIAVVNGDKRANYNDFHGEQESGSAGYAEAALKPGVEKVPEGTAVVDGEKDGVWDTALVLPLGVDNGAKARGEVRLLWDVEHLYVYADIADAEVNVSAKDPAEQDCLEICIDEKNDKSSAYDKNDKLYRINAEGEVTCAGKNAKEKYVTAVTKKTDGGYVIETCVKWTEFTPKVHSQSGLELRIKDADGSGRLLGTLGWVDGTDAVTENPLLFGTVKLAVAAEEPPESETQEEQPQETGGEAAPEEPADEPQGGAGVNPVLIGVLAAAAAAGIGIAAGRRKKKETGKTEDEQGKDSNPG